MWAWIAVLALAGEPEFGAPADGLSLGVEVLGPRKLALMLQNVSGGPMDVWSHVLADEEMHYDWYELRLEHPSGSVRVARLLDARKVGVPVKAKLVPGSQLRYELSLDEWLQRPMNGARPLAPGRYQLRVRYEVAIEGGWEGRVEVGPVELAVPDESGQVPEYVPEPEYVLEGDLLGED